MVLESPAFRTFVFKSVSRRLAHLMALVDEVAFRRVDQRLASRLILGRPHIVSTHQMLADDLGTSREVISRILETFQRSGMIRLGRKHIEIVDRKALDRFQRHGALTIAGPREDCARDVRRAHELRGGRDAAALPPPRETVFAAARAGGRNTCGASVTQVTDGGAGSSWSWHDAPA